MATRVKIGGIEATLGDEGWECADGSLRMALNFTSAAVDISGADPDPALTIAEDAINRFGGVLIEHEAPTSEEGVVY